MSKPRHTVAELLANAEREAKMRRQVYPSRVAKGTMKQGEADYLMSVQEFQVEVNKFLVANRDKFVEFLRSKNDSVIPPFHDIRTEIYR